MISVLDTYDPSKQYDLLTDMHGASGTHEQAEDWWHSFSGPDSNRFETTIAIAAMGRGRRSGHDGTLRDDVYRLQLILPQLHRAAMSCDPFAVRTLTSVLHFWHW
jgi:hypothetical protein